MEKRRKLLLLQAKEKHQPNAIHFCGVATSWSQCFTIENGKLCLWYNLENNTKMMFEGEKHGK